MKKRLLAILLTVCAAMVLLSTAVFATDTDVATADALKEAVGTDGTIKLTDNISMTESLTIASGTTVTIDLNGKNITFTNGYQIVNAGNLTIQDTSENADTNPGTIQITGTSAVNNTGSIEVESGKIFSDIGSGIYGTGTGTVTISGGTVEGWRGVYAGSGAKVCIEGGKVIGRTYYSNSIGVFVSGNGATVTMTSGTVTCSYYGVYARDGATAEISGGTVNGALGTYYGTIQVSGGTFDTDPSFFVTDSKKVAVPKTVGSVTQYTMEALKTENAVAMIGETPYNSLAAAINAAKTGNTVELKRDITLADAIVINKKTKIILDLGAHTLNGRIILDGGDLTVQNGTLKDSDGMGVIVYGSQTKTTTETETKTAEYSVLTVKSNAKLDATYAVIVAGYNNNYGLNTETGYGAVVNIEGTIDGNIWVMGNIGNSASAAEAMTASDNVINIESGANITGKGSFPAISLQGLVTVNVASGATLTGAEAIFVKSGTLNITGGVFNATGAKAASKPVANNSGTEVVGAAISITSTYNKFNKTTVNISGGTFNSKNYAGLSVDYTQTTNKDTGDVTFNKFTAGLDLTISGGEFNGAAGEPAIYVAEKADAVANNKVSYPENFITGGTFSTEPSSDYLASDYISTYENGVFTVIKKTDLKSETLNKPATGIETTISADTLKGLTEDQKTALTTAAASVSVPSVVNDEEAQDVQDTYYTDTDVTKAIAALKASDSGVTVKEGDIVTVYSQLYMDVKVTAYNEAAKTVTMDITPMVRLVASTAASADKIVLTGTEGTTKNAVAYGAKKATVDENETVEVSVTLPSEFKSQATVYVKHDASSGGTYYYKSSTNENGEMTFTSDHGFCPFTFSLEDSAAAWIGANGYDSLQEAVDVVGNNGEIDVTNENSDTIYVGRTVTFTINGTFKGKVVASNIYTTITTKDVTGGTEYTCVYTAPSVPVYRVVVNDAEGGKIKASANKAAEGATIVLTPVADDEEGALENLAVVDENGNAVTLTKRANGTYSFVMPAKAVTVTGTFTIVADPEEPDEDEEPGDEEEEATVFTDVDEDAYYAEAVAWAVANEITKGTSETTFSPDDDCTRAQVVTFLWRYAGKPEPTTTENPFTDVEEGTDYYKAILWAYENGITTGTSETTFSPDDTCTRAQVVTFLWRYEGELTYEEAETFTDVAEDAYYAKAVAWAVHEWITKGTGDGQFSPDETCSRGQVVTFLYRDTAEG